MAGNTSLVPSGFLTIENKTYKLHDGLNTIGRNLQAIVNIKDFSISHHHAIITILSNDLRYISDLKSSNGTILNGEKLSPLKLYKLEDGAEIKFANISCTYNDQKASFNNTSTTSQMSQLVDETFYNSDTQQICINNTVNIHYLPTQIINNSESYNQNLNIHDQPTQVIGQSQQLNIHDAPTQVFPHESRSVDLHDMETQVLTIENHPVLSDPMTEVTLNTDDGDSNNSIDLMTMQMPSETVESNKPITNPEGIKNNLELQENAQSSEETIIASQIQPVGLSKSQRIGSDSEETSLEAFSQIIPVKIGKSANKPLDSDSENETTSVSSDAKKPQISNYVISDDSETDIEEDSKEKKDTEKGNVNKEEINNTLLNDSEIIPATQDFEAPTNESDRLDSFNLQLSEISLQKENVDETNRNSITMDITHQAGDISPPGSPILNTKTNIESPDNLPDTETIPFVEYSEDNKNKNIEESFKDNITVSNDNLAEDLPDREHLISGININTPNLIATEKIVEEINPEPTMPSVLSEDEQTEDFYLQPTQKMNSTNNEMFKIPNDTTLSTKRSSTGKNIEDDLYIQPTQQLYEKSEENKNSDQDEDTSFMLPPTQSLEFLHFGSNTKEKSHHEVEDQLNELFASQRDAFNATQQLVNTLEESDIIEDSFVNRSPKLNKNLFSKSSSRLDTDIICTQTLLAGLEDGTDKPENNLLDKNEANSLNPSFGTNSKDKFATSPKISKDLSVPCSASENSDAFDVSMKKIDDTVDDVMKQLDHMERKSRSVAEDHEPSGSAQKSFLKESKSKLKTYSKASKQDESKENSIQAEKQGQDIKQLLDEKSASADQIISKTNDKSLEKPRSNKSSSQSSDDTSIKVDVKSKKITSKKDELKKKDVKKDDSKLKISESSNAKRNQTPSTSSSVSLKRKQSSISSEEPTTSKCKTRTIRKTDSDLISKELLNQPSSNDNSQDDSASRNKSRVVKRKIESKTSEVTQTKQAKKEKVDVSVTAPRRCTRQRTNKKVSDSEKIDDDLKSNISDTSSKNLDEDKPGTSSPIKSASKRVVKSSICSENDTEDDDDFEIKKEFEKRTFNVAGRRGKATSTPSKNVENESKPSRNTRKKNTSCTSTENETTTTNTRNRRLSANSRRQKAEDDNKGEPKTKNTALKNTPRNNTTEAVQLLQSPERAKRKLKPKVVFTMLDDDNLESIIRQLGGSVVDTVPACTVLVTGAIKRSQKLLCAVGQSKPICSPDWIIESKKAFHFLDPYDFILTDREAETKWQFSLKDSLARSNEKKLFENYAFQLMVNNGADVLKGAIEACGGKCVTRNLDKVKADNLVVVAVPENRSKFEKLVKQNPVIKVIEPEAIFDGVLRQEIRFNKHYIK